MTIIYKLVDPKEKILNEIKDGDSKRATQIVVDVLKRYGNPDANVYMSNINEIVIESEKHLPIPVIDELESLCEVKN
jgi:hypothetical protein